MPLSLHTRNTGAGVLRFADRSDHLTPEQTYDLLCRLKRALESRPFVEGSKVALAVGKARGVVDSIDDPRGTGRIRIRWEAGSRNWRSVDGVVHAS